MIANVLYIPSSSPIPHVRVSASRPVSNKNRFLIVCLKDRVRERQRAKKTDKRKKLEKERR